MSIADESVAAVKKRFQQGPNDSGSPEVQIALFTRKIENLSRHFTKHHLDKHSRRGLLKIVTKRKAMLRYLKEKDVNRYRKTIEALGLRK